LLRKWLRKVRIRYLACFDLGYIGAFISCAGVKADMQFANFR
jgi:hypothetical protein